MIIFHTPEALDLRVLRTLGLSAKPNSDSPIGQFGTGLKYAVAILLRHEQKISIWAEGAEHRLRTQKAHFRNTEFFEILLDDEPLPFTLDYGKNWELWQAYRELESNTRDEQGRTWRARPEEPLPQNGTAITVSGPLFEEVYDNRAKYFLESAPLETISGVEIHEGRSKNVYYRGILAYQSEEPHAFTYNILNETALTEDRTIKSSFTVHAEIGYASQKTKRPEIASAILNEKCEEWRYASTSFPANAFLDELIRRKHDTDLPSAWLHAVARAQEKTGIGFDKINLNGYERDILSRALRILEPLGVPLDLELNFVQKLGKGTHGVYVHQTGKIYIARHAFDEGASHLAAVIFEEYCHATHGYLDESRSFQTFLLKKVISFAERECFS